MKTVLLGDVAKVQGGGTPPTARSDYFGGQLAWFTPTEIVSGKISFLVDSVRTLTDTGAMFTAVAEPGTVLLTSRAGIGKVGILETRAGFNQGIKGITPKQDMLDSMYLAYWLIANRDLLEEKASGTTFTEISTTNVKNLEIPCPEIEEQRRVVKKLDEAFDKIDKAIELTQKNLQNSQELFDSKLSTIFDNKTNNWDIKKLEDLGKITSSKRIYKSEYTTNGTPFYRTKEVKELANDKSVTTELYISEKKYQEISRKFGKPKVGDILLTAIGTIGEVYVVKDNNEFYFKDGNVLWLKDFDYLNPYYLRYALRRFVAQLNKMSHGAAYNALPIQRLKQYEVALPNIDMQEIIVKNLDSLTEQTQKLQKLYKQKLDDLQELKHSLLKQAFEGKL